MRRLPWWAVGLVAAVIAYAALAAGLGLANAVTDPHCGLPGPELLVALWTLLVYPWIGFFVAAWLVRPKGAPGLKYALGVPLPVVAFLVNLVGLGPGVFPRGPCDDPPIRALAGLAVVGLAAALYARAGSSARNPDSSSATRSGRSSGRK